MRDLPEQARLPDARLADQGHDLPLPLGGELDRAVDLIHLGAAPHESGQAARGHRLQPRAGRPGAHELDHLHRRRQPLDRRRAEGHRLHEALDQPEGGRRHQDGAGTGELLHPAGQVRGLAHRRVVHVQVAADGPHHHLARVEAHPDRHRRRLAGLVAADGWLHGEGGVAGAERVVFVGDRGAEQRHDAVAHDLVDGAVEAVDRLHHPLEHGVEHLTGVLGVALGQQLEGPLEVGEEHGHVLALSQERLPGLEDLLGEMARGVALRRGEPVLLVLGRARAGHGRAAPIAELHVGPDRPCAGGADELEPGSALAAELRPRPVLRVTQVADHVSILAPESSDWCEGGQHEAPAARRREIRESGEAGRGRSDRAPRGDREPRAWCAVSEVPCVSLPLPGRERVGVRVALRPSKSVPTKRAPHPALSPAGRGTVYPTSETER